MLTSTLVIVSAAGIGALCLYYLYRTQPQPIQQETTLPNQNAVRTQIVRDRFLVLSSSELIEALDLSPLIANIKANLGLSDENWNKDALPFLNNYIEFVQRLPASESHHHAGDGGLVKHTLDVASLALVASTSQSWPPNAKTEDIAKKTAVWRYGIMCAAILHDVGKTITSFNIELYATPEDHEKTLWLPDAGKMADTGKNYYRVEFPDTKTAYGVHAEIAWTFFQALVPSHVRQWIASTDPDLMIALRSYLSGKKDGNQLQDVVTKADMASVSRDLKAGSRQRFATAKRTPLIEVIMETLREMLSDRGAHFSIATTAGGDLFRRDDKVYMMSKNVPDYIRNYLRSTQNRAAPSFPNDNQRIFDTLLEYRAVIPHEDDPHKAVSNIEVTFIRSDGEIIRNNFTVLCFRAEVLYPNGELPEEFKGELKVISPKERIEIRKTVNSASEVVEPPKNSINSMSMDFLDVHPSTVEIDQPTALSTDHAESGEVKTQIKLAPASINTVPEPVKLHGIDELLMANNLLETETEAAESVENSATEEKAIITEPVIKDILPSEPNAKKRKVNKSSRAVLNDLFAEKKAPQTSKKVHKVSQAISKEGDLLPEADKAQNGVNEIINERFSESTESPRPVAVAKSATLAEIQAGALEIVSFESDMAEAEIQNTLKKIEAPVIVALEEKKIEIRERGYQFLHWLGNGLADGSIPVNQSGAPVHFIERGMLLVSPAIFRDYAGGIFNKADSDSIGPMAQRGFESLRLHERTKRSALYRAIATNGSNKRLFYCFLIPEYNLKHVIQLSSRPANNTEIALEDDDLLNLDKS